MPWFTTSIHGIEAHYTRNPVEVDDIRPDIQLTDGQAEMIQREADWNQFQKEAERGNDGESTS